MKNKVNLEKSLLAFFKRLKDVKKFKIAKTKKASETSKYKAELTTGKINLDDNSTVLLWKASLT